MPVNMLNNKWGKDFPDERKGWWLKRPTFWIASLLIVAGAFVLISTLSRASKKADERRQASYERKQAEEKRLLSEYLVLSTHKVYFLSSDPGPSMAYANLAHGNNYLIAEVTLRTVDYLQTSSYYTKEGLESFGIKPDFLVPGANAAAESFKKLMKERGRYFKLLEKIKLKDKSGFKLIFCPYGMDVDSTLRFFLVPKESERLEFVTKNPDLFMQLELNESYSERNPLMTGIVGKLRKEDKEATRERFFMVVDSVEVDDKQFVYFKEVVCKYVQVNPENPDCWNFIDGADLLKMSGGAELFASKKVYSLWNEPLKSRFYLLKKVQQVVEKPDPEKGG